MTPEQLDKRLRRIEKTICCVKKEQTECCACPEEILNGAFDSVDNWTFRDGWKQDSEGQYAIFSKIGFEGTVRITYDYETGGGVLPSGNWTQVGKPCQVEHTPGNTTEVFLPPNGYILSGELYLVTLNVGGTTGTINVCLGIGDCQEFNAGDGAVSFIGTYVDSTYSISIGPSSDFDGIVCVNNVQKLLLGELIQEGQLVLGGEYTLTFDVGGTTGTIYACMGENGDCTEEIPAGTGKVTLTGIWYGPDTDPQYKVSFFPSQDFDGTIDNVSMIATECAPLLSIGAGEGIEIDTTNPQHPIISGTTATIYTGNGALAGNRLVTLDGNSLNFKDGSVNFLSLNQNDGGVILKPKTINAEIKVSDNIDGVKLFAGEAQITVIATDNILTYDATTHTFNGEIQYNGDAKLLSNRTVDLNGHELVVQQGGLNFLYIDPTTNDESVLLRADNNTNDRNKAEISASTTDLSANTYLRADFNDGTKTTLIRAFVDAATSTILHTADSHVFNGKINNSGLQDFANNAAAITGGLVTGEFYYTNVAGDGILKVVL